MHTRKLGKTGFEVTEIGFGTYAIGGAAPRGAGSTPTGYSGSNIFESIQMLRKAWARGITFYDTADVYGRGKSEVLINIGLHYVRKEAIIATKGGNILTAAAKDFSDEYLRGALNASLARMELASVPLYLLHSPSAAQMSEQSFATMRALKKEGKIASWGASVNGVAEAKKAIENGAEALEVVFNMVEPEMAKEIFPLARANNVGIIVREALCSGLLTGKFERGHVFPADDMRSARFPAQRIDNILTVMEKLAFLREAFGSYTAAAVAFVLSFPEVSTVILGCKSMKQLDANLALDGLKLTPDQVTKTLEIVAQGPNCSVDSKSFGFK